MARGWRTGQMLAGARLQSGAGRTAGRSPAVPAAAATPGRGVAVPSTAGREPFNWTAPQTKGEGAWWFWLLSLSCQGSHMMETTRLPGMQSPEEGGSGFNAEG